MDKLLEDIYRMGGGSGSVGSESSTDQTNWSDGGGGGGCGGGGGGGGSGETPMTISPTANGWCKRLTRKSKPP